MNTLQGKTALVTGAASGIGRASALLFAAEGASVVALDLAAEVEATVSAILSAGGRALALVADSSAEKDIAGAVALAVKEYGALDVCYANAGISGGLVPFFEETAERWTEVLKINLIGTFLAAKHAAVAMVPRRRGSIVCTASVAGLRSGAGGMPYSASKAGVISLVQTAANQLAGTGVRVNAICPGAVATAIYGRALGLDVETAQRTVDFMNSLLSESAPIRRTGRPLDIAEAALWLAGDGSGYVNGQAIVVDGGLLTGPLRRNRPGAGDPQAREAFRETLIKAAGEQESE